MTPWLTLCVRVQGNLDFVEEGEEARVKDRGVLQSVAMLLSVDEAAAQKALCSRVLAAQGDVMEKSHNVEQARRGRDAFAKVWAQDTSTNSFITNIFTL